MSRRRCRRINWTALMIIAWLAALTIAGVVGKQTLNWFDERLSNIEAAK